MSVLEQTYVPSENEPYMCARQVAYFKAKLEDMQQAALKRSCEKVSSLPELSGTAPDILDRANTRVSRRIELEIQDRQRLLISRIDAALARIKSGEYGYCLKTGDPIGLRRLEARPAATLCIEAQERREKQDKTRAI